MAVLYRKYRPQVFANVVGQQAVVKTLLNQVKTGSVAHAYLFTGSRGVGKTSVARILAKAVNCLNPKNPGQKSTSSASSDSASSPLKEKMWPGDACGECAVCRQIELGNFMDLVEIDAASNTGVDNIRDLIEHVKFSPSAGSYKVFIIDEVHMLSKGAFNALLKTLEEPPAHTIFILATTEINKVPATIVSRTQRFDFRRLPEIELVEMMSGIAKREKIRIDKSALELIAGHAEGGARDALSLLDKAMSLGTEVALEDVQRLLGVTDAAGLKALLDLIAGGQTASIPDFFSGLLERGADLLVFNRDFLELLRQGLVKVAVGKESHVSVNQYIFIIRLFLKSYKDIPSSPNAEIPLLIAALEAAGKFTAADKSTVHAASVGQAADGSGEKFSGAGNSGVLSHQTVTPSSFPQTPIREDSSDKWRDPVTSVVSMHESVPAVAKFAFTQVIEPTEAVSIPEQPVPDGQYDRATFEEMSAFIPRLVEELKKINGPLANLVKNSPLQGVEEGRLVFGVKYLFHKQNLENHKNFKVICEVLERVTGKKLGVCGKIIKAQDAGEKPDIVSEIAGALSILGGEVVE